MKGVRKKIAGTENADEHVRFMTWQTILDSILSVLWLLHREKKHCPKRKRYGHC